MLIGFDRWNGFNSYLILLRFIEIIWFIRQFSNPVSRSEEFKPRCFISHRGFSRPLFAGLFPEKPVIPECTEMTSFSI